MKEYPPIPRLADAPEVVEGGHLWIQELVDGGLVRFRLREDGRIEVGDRTHVYRDEVPVELRYAARHVRSNLDRGRLRAAVDRVEEYTFFGVGTHRRRVGYDFDRLPPVLGIDVRDAGDGAFRPPDAAAGIFERLGLDPVNAFEKERNARDFDPDDYEVPDSAWYDGPARGVVVRNKRGGRAKLLHPDFEDADPGDEPPSAAELAVEYATDRRIRRAMDEARDPDAALERVFDLVVRDAYPLIVGRDGVDPRDVRSAVAERLHSR